MSTVTFILKKPRLSTLVDQPGGTSTRSALKAVNEALEPLRAEGHARVGLAISELEAALAEADRTPRDALLTLLYARATAVLDAAGPFGLDDLCRAAFSLCELADRYGRNDRPVDVRGVAVHVQALRLLHGSADMPAEARSAVLDGLARVLERLPG